VVALAPFAQPEGRAHPSLRLFGQKLLELPFVIVERYEGERELSARLRKTCGKALKTRHLLLAGRAPGSPKVDPCPVARQVGRPDGFRAERCLAGYGLSRSFASRLPELPFTDMPCRYRCRSDARLDGRHGLGGRRRRGGFHDFASVPRRLGLRVAV